MNDFNVETVLQNSTSNCSARPTHSVGVGLSIADWNALFEDGYLGRLGSSSSNCSFDLND